MVFLAAVSWGGAESLKHCTFLFAAGLVGVACNLNTYGLSGAGETSTGGDGTTYGQVSTGHVEPTGGSSTGLSASSTMVVTGETNDPVSTTETTAGSTSSENASSSEPSSEDSGSTGRPMAVCGDGEVTPGELCYGASTPLPMGAEPYAVAVADLNLDTHADLIVVNGTGASTVTMRMGKGDGTFGVFTTEFVGMNPVAVVTPDVDGDGDPDVVTANQGDDSLSILLNDGLGNLAPQTIVTVDDSPTALGVLDLDVEDNGFDDLAVVHGGASTLIVFRNGGGGYSTMNTEVVDIGGNASAVQAGDFNGDAVEDVIVLGYSFSVAAMSSNGWGSLGPPMHSSVPSIHRGLALGDMNLDGQLDVVVATSAVNSTVRMMLGDGSGMFGPVMFFSGGNSETFGVLALDLTNDGEPDAALVSPFGFIFISRGDGAGGLMDPESYPTEGNSRSIASGDFNEDTVPDLVTANGSGNSVSVLLSTP